MAQTKRKRSSKHRGNAAGGIEARGRTGRPPSAEEKKKAARETSRATRLSRKPTWRSSSMRAGLAGVFMFLFLLLTDKHKVLPALIFAVLAMAIYVPAGFYIEMFLWRRRMAKQGTVVKR
jgi:hypothetical protein